MAKQLKVLFVDDAEDIVFLLKRVLECGGYEVHSERVDTAAAMESLLRSEVWEVVLCDHLMPEFRSTDALRILKQSALDIPFLVVSGSRDEAVAADAIAGGAFDFISKDRIDLLVATVESALQEFKDRSTRAAQVTVLPL